MSQRKRKLSRELEGLSLSTSHEWKMDEIRGRISGDKEWRKQRGELGTTVDEQDDARPCDTMRKTPIYAVTESSPGYMFPGTFVKTLSPSKDGASHITVSRRESDGLELYSIWLGGNMHDDTESFQILPPVHKSLHMAQDTVHDGQERFKSLFKIAYNHNLSSGMEASQATAIALKTAKEGMQHMNSPALTAESTPSFSSTLRSLSVYAGKSFVNGIKCNYHERSGKKLFYEHFGNHDEPRRLDLELGEGTISKISIRYGNIVDGLTFTIDDVDNIYGGTGGEFENVVFIPEGFVLIGFFGGIGGHLHNLGIILHRSSEGE